MLIQFDGPGLAVGTFQRTLFRKIWLAEINMRRRACAFVPGHRDDDYHRGPLAWLMST